MKLHVRFGHAEYSDQVVNDSIASILSENILMSMAFVDGHQSYISTAYYACDSSLTFYFMSNPQSLHARILDHNPSVALSVFDSRQEWDCNKRGLQLFGKAHAAKGLEVLHGGRLYLQHFASLGKIITHMDDLMAQGGHIKLYAVEIHALKVLDEERFGHHKSLELRPIRD